MSKTWQTLLAVVIFILCWWGLSSWVASSFLPSPLESVEALFRRLSAPRGLVHVGLSFSRVCIGTLLGAVVGTTLGVATRYIKVVEIAVRSVIYPLLQAVPTICWALMFILLVGFNSIAPILSVMVASTPIFIINTLEGMKELDTNLIEMASSYTHRPFKILGKVVMPMLYPYIFAATKSGFMTAWRIIIPAEIFGTNAGMGFMIHQAWGSSQIDDVFGWTLAFATILIFFDHVVFNFIDRKFIRKWKPQKTK